MKHEKGKGQWISKGTKWKINFWTHGSIILQTLGSQIFTLDFHY